MPAERAPTLAEVEERLFRLITAPSGVAAGLAAIGMEPADLERIVRSDARRSAVGRLDVYADMYFFRIRDALAELFPALATALGEIDFHNLVTDYLLAHPSEHPSLRNVGDHLAPFLDPREKWHADLVRLEWARNQVFDGQDAPVLTIEALQALPPERFATLPLRLIPSLERVDVQFAVESVWSAAIAGQEIAEPEAGARTLLVWRRELDVLHRALGSEEAEALALAAGGRPFGAICDHLLARAPDSDEGEVAGRAFRLLAQWVSDGLLRSDAD